MTRAEYTVNSENHYRNGNDQIIGSRDLLSDIGACIPAAHPFNGALLTMDVRKREIRLSRSVRAAWPIALMATIMWASGASSPGGVGWLSIPHFDKIAHFFVFGLVATLILRALPGSMSGLSAMMLAILATSLFGFGDELRQSFNPHRHMEFADWVADTLGAIIAVVVYVVWPSYRKALEKPLNPLWRRAFSRLYRGCRVSEFMFRDLAERKPG